MKKILSVILLTAVIFSLCACAYVADREECEVEAMIVETEYVPKKHHVAMSGKTCIPITHQEQFNVTLEYQGYKRKFNNEELYNACAGLEGGIIVCTATAEHMSDGTVRYYLHLPEN